MNPLLREYFLPDTQSTEALGALLADRLSGGATIYLEGDLGSGKTTFVRGALHGLGYRGIVKSPTFTLVEPYELAHIKVFHFDLYRLEDPEELDWIGIRDFFQKDCVSFIEWPDKGHGLLPNPDLKLSFLPSVGGRRAMISGSSDTGQKIIHTLHGSNLE